jgi:phage tail sheath protein FI
MADYGRPGVYISERLLPAPIAATGTANAAGAVVGAFAQGPTTVTLVTSWYDFVKQFGGYNANFPATFGVGQFFANGGSELYVRRVLATDATQATNTIAPLSGETSVGSITAKNKGADGKNIRVTFAATSGGLYTVSVYKEGGSSYTDSDATNDVLVERFTNITLTDTTSSDYIVTVLDLRSAYITAAITHGNIVPVTTPIALTNGSDGSPVVSSDFVSALSSFNTIDRPLVLFAPEVTDTAVLGETNGKVVQNALLAWAAANDGFAVLDVPKGTSTNAQTVDETLDYASGLTATSYGAVYYPSVYISDPLGRSSASLRKVGPAGGVAGLYIATDKQFGPFKSPAGLRASLRNVVAVEYTFTSAELDRLNTGTKLDGSITKPVNAIRNLPGAGIVVMGARTLKQDTTANSSVNLRRSLIYIRKSLSDLTQFALFENNDEKLWSQLRTTVSVFLTSYLNQGGLRGTTPDAAFYVKCDSETNSVETIAAGEVHLEVGVALPNRAEFVVINLSQKTAA